MIFIDLLAQYQLDPADMIGMTIMIRVGQGFQPAVKIMLTQWNCYRDFNMDFFIKAQFVIIQMPF